MTRQLHEEILRGSNAKWQEKLDKIIAECERKLEIERAKQIPKRITFDWKFSDVSKVFILICLIFGLSVIGNIRQYSTIKNQTQTIKELNTFSVIFRFARANDGISASAIDRIWQEYQTPDTTALKLHIHKVIAEYESGESIIKNTKNNGTRK